MINISNPNSNYLAIAPVIRTPKYPEEVIAENQGNITVQIIDSVRQIVITDPSKTQLLQLDLETVDVIEAGVLKVLALFAGSIILYLDSKISSKTIDRNNNDIQMFILQSAINVTEQGLIAEQGTKEIPIGLYPNQYSNIINYQQIKDKTNEIPTSELLTAIMMVIYRYLFQENKDIFTLEIDDMMKRPISVEKYLKSRQLKKNGDSVDENITEEYLAGFSLSEIDANNQVRLYSQMKDISRKTFLVLRRVTETLSVKNLIIYPDLSLKLIDKDVANTNDQKLIQSIDDFCLQLGITNQSSFGEIQTQLLRVYNQNQFLIDRSSVLLDIVVYDTSMTPPELKFAHYTPLVTAYSTSQNEWLVDPPINLFFRSGAIRTNGRKMGEGSVEVSENSGAGSSTFQSQIPTELIKTSGDISDLIDQISKNESIPNFDEALTCIEQVSKLFNQEMAIILSKSNSRPQDFIAAQELPDKLDQLEKLLIGLGVEFEPDLFKKVKSNITPKLLQKMLKLFLSIPGIQGAELTHLVCTIDAMQLVDLLVKLDSAKKPDKNDLLLCTNTSQFLTYIEQFAVADSFSDITSCLISCICNGLMANLALNHRQYLETDWGEVIGRFLNSAISNQQKFISQLTFRRENPNLDPNSILA
jgi:hypothetical protein